MRLTKSIPYPSFTKIIIDHILTEHPDIPKRFNEPYHRAKNDEVVKSILNYGKRKGLGMRILKWLLTEEIKQTKHYKVYVGELNIEVPMTLSQPIESMQETLSTSGAPRPPNPQEHQARSIEDFEAQQAIKKVDEHLMDEDIEKIVEGDEETDADNLEDEKVVDYMTINEEVEEESAEAELKRKKWKGIGVIARMSRRYGYIFCHMKKYFMPRRDMDAIGKEIKDTLKEVVHKMVDETTNQNMKDNLTMVVTEGIKLEWEKTKADIASMVAEAVRKEQERTRAELSLQVSNDVATNVPPQVDAFLRNYMNNNILHVHPTESASSSIPNLQQQLYLKMKDDEQARNADLPIWLALMTIMDDDDRMRGGDLVRTDKTKTSEHSTFTRGESSLQTMEESNLSSSSAQEQQEDFDPSCVIWERVHGYQLGLESYQQKVNLTTPTLTFSGIEEQKPYTINFVPLVGLIYENCKKEKRITNIDEISKFCDATLKRVLEKVKKIKLDVKHGYADPALSKDGA
ncbi:hypothetical protein Tco_0200533 [Tanacetum coccineum]